MMKLGIVGRTGSGKTTVFTALTHHSVDPAKKGNNLVVTIRVPEPRIDMLRDIYKPKKTTCTQIEYLLPGKQDSAKQIKGEQPIWTPVRDCDALIHVTRNFVGYDAKEPTPYQDFLSLNQDLMLADLLVLEKRLERMELDHKRGEKYDQTERSLLKVCQERLNTEIPLRGASDLAEAPLLRGYAFVSAKPMLVLFNNDDDIDEIPDIPELTSTETCMAIKGRLEQELAQMAPDEAEEFLTAFGITSSAKDRIIQKSYELLGLISFFTVVGDEVRAWAIKRGTTALAAAGTVHTDMEKGFIRAEVLAYNDLMDAGTYQAAKKKGTVRLEGKTYPVRDGDIINFRFNI